MVPRVPGAVLEVFVLQSLSGVLCSDPTSLEVTVAVAAALVVMAVGIAVVAVKVLVAALVAVAGASRPRAAKGEKRRSGHRVLVAYAPDRQRRL